MPDPIQPAGEFHVYSVEEVQKMAPFLRDQYVKTLTAHLASIDPYVPLQPRRRDELRSIFGALMYDQRVGAWDEGYLEAARDMDPQGVAGVMPWQLAKNPYRSES